MSEIHAVDGEPEDEREQDQIVDVDLDAMDDALRREAVGEATTVRIDGVIIHVAHASAWPSSAMLAATKGDWETWARAVIPNDAEFQAWADADLMNYQIEAVFAQCGRQARLTAGKSARLSGSSRRSRRK